MTALMPRLYTQLREGLGPEPSQSHLSLEVDGQIVSGQFDDSSSPMDADGFNGNAAQAISFGAFRLLAAQRLLLHGDKPVRLGSRALDILIALVERHGELVNKRELMARVWPDTTVVESNLTVHVAGLRRALQDGHGGNRYIVNIPGRGYRFVAPVTLDEVRSSTPTAAATKRRHDLPARLTRPIGRAETINELIAHLQQWRLLTSAGPGGIGKTTIALAVAEQLKNPYHHGVWLVDLAQVSDLRVVPDALTVALAHKYHSDGSLPQLIAPLGDKQMLLILDNCEHVIRPVAELVTAILRGTSNVRTPATSC